MPKLILQPLLENAMKHGFAESLDVAMLVIVAKKQEGKLLLDMGLMYRVHREKGRCLRIMI